MPFILLFLPLLVRISAYLRNFFPCKPVLLPEQAVNFRLHLCIGEIIIGSGKIPHQLIGVVPDLTDLKTVFIISGVVFLRPVNLHL